MLKARVLGVLDSPKLTNSITICLTFYFTLSSSLGRNVLINDESNCILEPRDIQPEVQILDFSILDAFPFSQMERLPRRLMKMWTKNARTEDIS